MTQKRVAFRFAVLTRIKLKLQNHIDPQLGVGLREECPVLHTHTSFGWFLVPPPGAKQ